MNGSQGRKYWKNLEAEVDAEAMEGSGLLVCVSRPDQPAFLHSSGHAQGGNSHNGLSPPNLITN